MAWIIKGESGKTLDASSHSLDSLNISGCVLQFQSLAYDTLKWTASTADATGAGTIVPDFGQIVELWWDSTRKFRGHVTGVVMAAKQIQIVVNGPWWWMERTNLTEVQTDAQGGTAERHTYVFPTQSLATSIATLIARAITNGVPMTAGSVATIYSVPKMTLTEDTCANALALLFSWCPDAVAWFDYSGSGAPILNVTRRGVAGTITYTIATDAVEIGDITPRMDLEVTRNELHYVTRNGTTGKPAWASQVSGTDVAGKRQIVTVSGPEIVDFLPKDDFESASIQTIQVSVLLADAIRYYDPAIIDLKTRFNWDAGVVSSGFYDYGKGGYILFPAPVCRDKTGIAQPTAPWYFIYGPTPPSWALTTGAELTCTVWMLAAEPVVSTGWSPQFEAFKNISSANGTANPTWTGSAAGPLYWWAVHESVVTGWAIPAPYPTRTTIYKPWEYDFAVPPAGLAANLVAAQNWVPWEGPITLAADECSADNLLPNKFRLANGLAPCATMDALARGISHNLMLGRTTVDLGAPARIDFGTLVSRVKSQPQDNIVYL